MRKFINCMLFSLLAVGWTSNAPAQVKARESLPLQLSKEMVEMTPRQVTSGHRMNAPRRANETADVTHVKSWYENFMYTWEDASGTHQSSITEPATKPEQIKALTAYIYETKEIPGTQYSVPLGGDIPYDGVDFGYYISGEITENIVISMTRNVQISSITITDKDDQEITSLTPGQNRNGWTVSNNVSTYNYGATPYWYVNQNYGSNVYTAFTISRNLLVGRGAVKVKVNARSTQAHTPYGYYTDGRAAYSSTTHYTYFVNYEQYAHGEEITTEWADYVTPVNAPINAPDENGYTVLLVKLSNDVDYANTQAPEYTKTTEELINYFETYVKEVQLLTDGLRVDDGTSSAGTVFAYTGDLNRFYFISKGKLAYIGGSENPTYWFGDNTNNVYYYNYEADRAPFYNMYEEFSPTTQQNTSGIDDFYSTMKQGETYSIIHDCNSVNFMEHFFSLAGTAGTTENRVNSLVLYIPDDRGQAGSETISWRDYDHQPTVGMYMIDLYADVEPSSTPDYYTVTVNWYDNLDEITHTDNIPQTYRLYEIRYNEQTGQNDTTLVYEGPDTSWTQDYPVGDPTYYDLHYYVIGTPTDATNQDTFFAKSNTDDVTIPGKEDFLGLQWWRYESDYVTDDGTNQEVNYYRNWLAPHALAVQGETGITAGNVGTMGRTLTLYRDDTPVIDLELVMDGNKAFYRIKYRPNTQKVEPGYDPNTGERTSTNN